MMVLRVLRDALYWLALLALAAAVVGIVVLMLYVGGGL